MVPEDIGNFKSFCYAQGNQRLMNSFNPLDIFTYRAQLVLICYNVVNDINLKKNY